METNLLPIDLKDKILMVRGQYVMLDADAAEIYGVETKRINEAVKNNPEKFPDGYIIHPDYQEIASLRSKISTANGENELISSKSRYTPKLFTERGLYMLATILKSERAFSDFAITTTHSSPLTSHSSPLWILEIATAP